MRRLNTLLLLAVAAIALVSSGCKRDNADKTILTVAKTTFDLSSSSTTIKVEVTHNCDFDYEIDEAAKEWIHHDESRAKQESASSVVYFKVSANENVEARSATITFRSSNGAKQCQVIVNQAQKDCISSQSQNINVDYTTQQLTIDVESNTEYRIDISGNNTEWIRQAGSRAMEHSTITFDIDENLTSTARTAFIRLVSSSTYAYTIEVIQEAAPHHIRLVIGHNSSSMETPIFNGDNIFGQIEWGDNTSEEWSKDASHTFTDEGTKQTTFDMYRSHLFTIPHITGIESIEIYYNE